MVTTAPTAPNGNQPGKPGGDAEAKRRIDAAHTQLVSGVDFATVAMSISEDPNSAANGGDMLNSPFTFQSMEKHAAYCAMMRLGLKVPETVLVPFKNPVDNARYAYTAARYNRPFDLDAIAAQIGYPLFMKPYDGGAWRGVSRINNAAELHSAYDASGEMLMHLQKAVDYDVFARSLSIGAETMVMKFQPDQPMHLRYAVDHSFLSPQVGEEVVTIGRLVNAFFRWEFNSCETHRSRAGRSTPSTTPTPARTSRSPACTTTSPGR